MMKWKSNNKIKYAIGHGVIQIGGIMYTYDKLAEMLGIGPNGENVPPKVSSKKRQQLEKLFQAEKPKTEKQVLETIDKNLTDEGSLAELQKLMDESLAQDAMSNNVDNKSEINKTPTTDSSDSLKPVFGFPESQNINTDSSKGI